MSKRPKRRAARPLPNEPENKKSRTDNQTLVLLCLLEGDTKAFSLEVESNQYVDSLKVAIKEKKPNALKNVDAKDLQLWKISRHKAEAIKLVKGDMRDDELDETSKISVHWQEETLADGVIHVFVAKPMRVGSNILRKLGPMGPLAQYWEKHKYIAPSIGSKPSQFRVQQENPEKMIFCGRPATAVHTVPPTLLHPVFAQFVEDCESYEPTFDDYNLLAELVDSMSKIYETGHDRMVELRAILNKHGLSFVKSFIDGACSTDGDVNVQIGELLAFIAFLEGKNEIGATGAEPLFKIIFYYLEAIRQMLKKNGALGATTNFPSLLVTVFGPYICVSGAVFTGCDNIQILSPGIPLFFHYTDTSMKKKGAQFLGALKNAIESLRTYYVSEAFLQPCQPQYPFQRSYTDVKTSSTVEFSYEHHLDPDRLIFFAREKETGDSICVKFVRQYSREAHNAFDCAPKLRGFDRLPGGWYLVVMDDLRGNYRKLERDDRTPELKATLTSIIERFHQLGYVHGDVRDVNIMVGRREPTTFVVFDFDWAGKEGEAKYPMNVFKGRDLWRPEDVFDTQPIKPEHDMAMLEHIFMT